MATPFLNIKKSFSLLGRSVFFVRFVVNKFLAFIITSALLISKKFLSLQIVQNSFLNIRKVASAKSNLPPKALDFQGLLFLSVCNRLIKC